MIKCLNIDQNQNNRKKHMILSGRHNNFKEMTTLRKTTGKNGIMSTAVEIGIRVTGSIYLVYPCISTHTVHTNTHTYTRTHTYSLCLQYIRKSQIYFNKNIYCDNNMI